MRCLYTSRNNSFNQSIFQSKILGLLSRNYKNKKKITIETLSFRHKLNTSKLSHTNSYLNTNTNTNPNSIIKQNGNYPKKKNSKTKISINNKHKFSMSNDNFNEFTKIAKNMDIINTIYTTKNNSKNKNNYISMININNKGKKRKNSKNCIKKEKSSKINNKNVNTKNKILINLENELSLKQENQRLKMKLMELQNELDKIKNGENDLSVSQNRNKNSCLSIQKEKMEISEEKKPKKINKLNNNLNLELNNIDNNYPCDYFNVINNTSYNVNNKSSSPMHDYIGSNRKIITIFQEKNLLSHNNKSSRYNNNINFEKNGNYFTIANRDKKTTSKKNSNNKKLNSPKNKILLSMFNLNNIKPKMNKSSTRIITQSDNSYTYSTILNTEKFIKNLKKSNLKEKFRPQQLIYFSKNVKKKDGCTITKDHLNEKANKIGLNKGNTINLFDFHKNKKSLTSRGNSNNKSKNKIKINENDKFKNEKEKEKEKAIEKTNINMLHNQNGMIIKNGCEYKNLEEKMKSLYDRAKNLLSNYETFIAENINLNK